MTRWLAMPQEKVQDMYCSFSDVWHCLHFVSTLLVMFGKSENTNHNYNCYYDYKNDQLRTRGHVFDKAVIFNTFNLRPSEDS